MKSTLFTELTISEEASLSGGGKNKKEHKKNKPEVKIVIRDVYAGDGGDGGSVNIDL